MIRLHDYWRSSACYRVRIALGLAGLDWVTHAVDLVEGDQRTPEHLSVNPQGLVPALEIDGHTLTQSLAIIEYLDETRGLGLLPASPLGRARVRTLAHAVAMDIHPICNTGVASFVVEQSSGTIAMQTWMHRFVGPGLVAVEAMLPGGDHAYADRVTLADICLMPQLYNARRWDIDLSRMPKLLRIEATLQDIPAFAAGHPDRARR